MTCLTSGVRVVYEIQKVEWDIKDKSYLYFPMITKTIKTFAIRIDELQKPLNEKLGVLHTEEALNGWSVWNALMFSWKLLASFQTAWKISQRVCYLSWQIKFCRIFDVSLYWLTYICTTVYRRQEELIFRLPFDYIFLFLMLTNPDLCDYFQLKLVCLHRMKFIAFVLQLSIALEIYIIKCC